MANGSEAKIADVMIRVLHQQGLLGDAGSDLRFNMRPGGNPGRGEHGGVVEAFTVPGSGAITLNNRFGEPVPVARAGAKVDLSRPLSDAVAASDPAWRALLARLRVTRMHHGELQGRSRHLASAARAPARQALSAAALESTHSTRIPLPLVVLAAVGLLLVMGGSAGLIGRRLR